MKREHLRIGVVVKPQGVRGEVKVQILSDTPQRFEKLECVLFELDGTLSERNVESAYVRGGAAFMKLEGVHSREQADALRGAYLCVSRTDAITLPPGHHFICDLVGCNVLDSEGRALGVLRDVLQYGTADVYVIRPQEGAAGKSQTGLMVPALKRLLVRVEPEQQRIVLDAGVLEEVAVWDEDGAEGRAYEI